MHFDWTQVEVVIFLSILTQQIDIGEKIILQKSVFCHFMSLLVIGPHTCLIIGFIFQRSVQLR